MNLITHQTLELAIDLQQIPAPTFMEHLRTAKVAALFQQERLLDVEIDPTGNVYGRLSGGAAPPLVISAHLDTVFPETTSLNLIRTPERISGPGIGDNSLGLAGLFGVLWLLREDKFLPEGDIWFVANVGEEGLGDLRGMRAAVDRFGDLPTAYLVLEGMSLGHIYHRALGVQRYKIAARTQGGHSWVNYGRPSAIHALAGLVARLANLPISVEPRASLNVGIIEGGTSINTIAPHASCLLDLRSEDPGTLTRLVAEVEALVNASPGEGVSFSLERIGDRPAGEIPPDDSLVRLGAASLEKLGVPVQLGIGSTDANIPLSRGLPAICIGLTTGGGAHTEDEYINVAPLETGLAHVYEVVRGVWGR